MRLVQISRNGKRRVGAVEGDSLRLLSEAWPSVYELAVHTASSGKRLAMAVAEAISVEILSYDAVYRGVSDWRLLPAFDHPTDPAHCMVSGTGLTHKASAQNRAAMHAQGAAEVTDSAKMYSMGLEGGSPAPGAIGVQPEWFYKGDGSILRGHGDELSIPAYAWDGGEEPEIAGVYVISQSGVPCRVGLTVGNEFSDHKMEKRNYLYLAPSKLRNCAIGPELTIGDAPFDDVAGKVSVLRGHTVLWSKKIWTGGKNMSHTVANLEHHHFKFEGHRRPGQAHVHFFGADAFSFGEGLALEPGDAMEIDFPEFGRPLRNILRMESGPETWRPAKAL